MAVLDTANLSKFRIVASFAEFDIAWVEWADDTSLVFSIRDETAPMAGLRGSGLYAIGIAGEGMRTLINFRGGGNSETGTMIKQRSLQADRYSFGQRLHDGSGDIVVEHWNETLVLGSYGSERTGNSPVRMNVRTGALTEMGSKWPDHVLHWEVDAQGKVRGAM